MRCKFKSLLHFKKENISLKLVSFFSQSFCEYTRRMKALVSFTCHVSRETNSVSPSVQPQIAVISFTRETDLMLEGTSEQIFSRFSLLANNFLISSGTSHFFNR